MKHGGVRYSEWTVGKLRRVWESYVGMAGAGGSGVGGGSDDGSEAGGGGAGQREEGLSGVWMTKWEVVNALKAMKTCGGGKEGVLGVWEGAREASGGWSGWGEEEKEVVGRVLRGLVDECEGEERDSVEEEDGGDGDGESDGGGGDTGTIEPPGVGDWGRRPV